jgi:hypothetical protein
MATTTIYDQATMPGASVKSAVFSVAASGNAAIRLKGTARGSFRATLEFSDGGTVVYQGSVLELGCTSNVAMLVQTGDFRFDIVNPDGDAVQLEVRT